MDRLAIVVPCYNEEEVFPETARQLTERVKDLVEKQKIAENSFILFVNDGSRDRTWPLIRAEFEKNPYVFGLNLAGNVGHQAALLAGLMTVKDLADVSISIDADLQDDIGVMEEMIDRYHEGCDIVYGVRSQRKTDSFFKKATAQGFYKFMSAMGAKTVYNHADYRLMSARALQQLSHYEERNLFLRGIAPLIGYQTACVYYARKERFAGESKYPLKKMLAFAFDGITSFSVKPITFICVLGLLAILVSLAAIIYALVVWIMGDTVSGWTSLFASIWFLGGVQLLSIGIVGQYVGKTYIESKKRPLYNIESFLQHDEKGQAEEKAEN